MVYKCFAEKAFLLIDLKRTIKSVLNMKRILFFIIIIQCFLWNNRGLAQESVLLDGEDFKSDIILFHPENLMVNNGLIKYTDKKITVEATHTKLTTLTLNPVKINLNNPKPFISSYTVWKGTGIYKNNLNLSFRTSTDGVLWTDWKKTVFEGHFEENGEQLVSVMTFLKVNVKFIQYKVAFSAKEKITISNIKINQYSPGNTPEKTKLDIKNKVNDKSFMGCEKPNVISRDQWNARYVNGDIFQPTIATHLIVHHEVGANTSSDWAARVRAIQNFHMDGNGWSDIGYNFLISPTGTIYEGRAGGDRSTGAHFCGKNSQTMGVCMLGDYSTVTPTNLTQEALASLFAWKANKENIDPEGASYHYSVGTLNNIAGHRDGGGCTVCPGDGGYDILENLRTTTGTLLDNDCNDVPIDTMNPTTTVSVPGGTAQAGDFNVNFNDNDNIRVTRKYYQALEKYGDNWYANSDNGFFNDNYNELYSGYALGDGNWSSADGHLRQSNTLSENTSLSTSLSQNTSLPYLYEFSAKIISQDGPRKFGIHIMSSDYSLSERGNSYLIWFSGEDNKLRIYETADNVLNIRETVDVELDNEWSNYKITYSPSYGVIQVFKNNKLVLYWTDTSPITSGNAISLRTNATEMDFDDLKVYKYRANNSVTITAGDEVTKDIRTTQGRINSLVRDEAGNWSQTGSEDVTISTILGVNDTYDLNASNKIMIYPNPTDGSRVVLKYYGSFEKSANLSIIDIGGRMINTIKQKTNTNNIQSIDLSGYFSFLQSGYYFIKVDNGMRTHMIKVLKK